MPNRYSYSMGKHPGDWVRSLDVDCNRCCAGVFEITVNEGRAVSAVVNHCDCSRDQFENDYANGLHAAAVAMAIQAADKLEAEGPDEEQLSALYDPNGPSVANSVYRLAEARRWKR